MSSKNILSALIIGPTDKTKIFRFGKIKPADYLSFLEEISLPLVKYCNRINLISDEGIPLDVARVYKRLGGQKAIGYVPHGGQDSLKPYFSVFDSVEEFDSGWNALNTCLSLKGDIVVAFGLSPGTIVELAYTSYHKRFLGKIIPIFLDSRTISRKLNPEIEENLAITYFNSGSELEDLLRKGCRNG